MLRKSELIICQFEASSGQFSYVGQLDGLNYPNNLVLQDTRAYISDRSGLRIVDISDPAHPSELTCYQSAGPISYVAVSGNSAFLSVSDTWPACGLKMVDISNPYSITEVGWYSPEEEAIWVGQIVVADGYAFMVWHSTMLGDYRVDIIEVPSLRRVAQLGSEPINAIAISDPYLFLCYSVLDISDIANPKRIGYHPDLYGMKIVSGSYVYACQEDTGLSILDWSGLRRRLESAIMPSTWGHIKSRFK